MASGAAFSIPRSKPRVSFSCHFWMTHFFLFSSGVGVGGGLIGWGLRMVCSVRRGTKNEFSWFTFLDRSSVVLNSYLSICILTGPLIHTSAL